MIDEDLTLCSQCTCMTHSIRQGRALFICGKCGHNKTLGDVYQYELQEQLRKMKEKKNKNE